MERVILVLAMLSGLHLILSFLQVLISAIRGYFKPISALIVNADVIEDAMTDWQQFDTPAYMRRNRLQSEYGNKGKASFEVIA